MPVCAKISCPAGTKAAVVRRRWRTAIMRMQWTSICFSAKFAKMHWSARWRRWNSTLS